MAFDTLGFLYFLEPYALMLVLVWFALAKLTDGFLVKYLTVRTKRNSKCLIMVKGIHRRNFWLVGDKLEDGISFYWKKRLFKKDETLHETIKYPTDKDNKPIDVFYTFGIVDAVNIDERTKKFLEPNLTEGDYYDFNKVDSLYLRALYKPDLNEGKEGFILFLLIIITLGVIGCVFMLYQMGKKVDAAYQACISINKL